MSSDLSPSQSQDFLNRDYDGYRQLMLSILDSSGTGWTQRSAADPGIAVLEALAYRLDQLAYAGDRVAGESFLSTSLLRESIRKHAELAGGRLDPGNVSSGFQHVEIAPQPGRGGLSGSQRTLIPAGTHFLRPAAENQTRSVFECKKDSPVSALWNHFTLRSEARSGEDYLKLSGATEDLRQLGLPEGSWLAITDAAGETLVQVLGVQRDQVRIADPLKRGWRVDSKVLGNLVAIRQGVWVGPDMTDPDVLSDYIAGAAVGDVDLVRACTLRLRCLTRLSDEAELYRQDWTDSARRRWRSAQALLDALVQQLRSLSDAGRLILSMGDPVPITTVMPSPVPALREELRRRSYGTELSRRVLMVLLDDVERDLRQVIEDARFKPEIPPMFGWVPIPGQRLPLIPGYPVAWEGDDSRDARALIEVRVRENDIPHRREEPRDFLSRVIQARRREGSGHRWERVQDFLQSGSQGRHYRLECDNDLNATLVFGDGESGCMPPPGATIEVSWVTDENLGNNVARQQLSEFHFPAGRRDVPKIVRTFNPTKTTGARPAASIQGTITALRTRSSQSSVPATLIEFGVLAREQPEVLAAWSELEDGVIVLAARPAPGVSRATMLSRLTTLLHAPEMRLAGAVISVRAALPRYVNVGVALSVEPLANTAYIRRAIRDQVLEVFEKIRSTSLGRRLGPGDVALACQSVPEVSQLSVFDFDYADRSEAHNYNARLLLPARDRYLECQGGQGRGEVTILLTRSFSVRIRLSRGEKRKAARREIVRLLSGPGSALHTRTRSSREVLPFTIEDVLFHSRTVKIDRVSRIWDGRVRTRRIWLRSFEVLELDRLIFEGGE